MENIPGPVPLGEVPYYSGESTSRGSMLELDFSAHSDAGKVRARNEDAHGHLAPANPAQARSRGWLFVVADGVGGHDRGEVASRMAVDCLLAGFPDSRAGEPHSTVLTRLAQQANLRVYEAGRSASPGGTPMATTLVACALRYDRSVVAHVGDSRCYLIRRGRATLLTRDHTVANEHVRMGVISAGEAASSAHRHLLVRSLGSDLFVNVDIAETQVVPGDVLLLCCDGLHGALPAEDLAAVVTHNRDLQEAALQLVALANERDGSDNITVQLIRVRAVERVGMYRGRPYKLR